MISMKGIVSNGSTSNNYLYHMWNQGHRDCDSHMLGLVLEAKKVTVFRWL